MSIQKSFVLLISVIVIVGSIILSRIGFKNSTISLKSAAFLGGIGAGVGDGFFIFFVVSNKDFIGSILTSIITAIVVGVTVYLFLGKYRN